MIKQAISYLTGSDLNDAHVYNVKSMIQFESKCMCEFIKLESFQYEDHIYYAPLLWNIVSTTKPTSQSVDNNTKISCTHVLFHYTGSQESLLFCRLQYCTSL